MILASRLRIKAGLAPFQVFKKTRMMKVLHLQGAKQAGIRVSARMNWISLFADQSVQIAQNSETTYTRLVLPHVYNIEGLATMTEAAMARYRSFIAVALLSYSQDERAYMRDFPKSQREI